MCCFLASVTNFIYGFDVAETVRAEQQLPALSPKHAILKTQTLFYVFSFSVSLSLMAFHKYPSYFLTFTFFYICKNRINKKFETNLRRSKAFS